jgi:hypothetical protein
MLLALSLPGIVTAADGLKKVTLEWFKYVLLGAAAVLAGVLFYIRKQSIDDYFHEIKNLIGPKETDLTHLNNAMSEINNVSKLTYVAIDSVDIKLDGFDYKFVKCEVYSPYVEVGVSKSPFICALDRSSSKVAKGMYDLLVLSDEGESASIFHIKDH